MNRDLERSCEAREGSADALRGAMRQFATGVTVVTTRLDDRVCGLTANAITSVSLEPPLVLVCIGRRRLMHDILSAAGAFAASILHVSQRGVAEFFATPHAKRGGDDSLCEILVAEGAGLPTVRGCLAWLQCRVVQRHEAGDHTIFIGRVMSAGSAITESPLVFYGGGYTTILRKASAQGG